MAEKRILGGGERQARRVENQKKDSGLMSQVPSKAQVEFELNRKQPEFRGHCPACDSGDFKYAFTRGEYDIFSCKKCSLKFTGQVPSEETLKEYYSGQDTSICPDDVAADEVMTRVLESIPAGAKALDIGCGYGKFMIAAKERGIDCIGVDTDPKRVEACKAKGLDVRQGFFPAVDVGGDFDLIWFSHIIEHLTQPGEVMVKIAELLKPGGLLCIRTPNASSLPALICKAHHTNVIPPEHLTYWNHKSLKMFAAKFGFAEEFILTRDAEYNLKDIAAYFLKAKFMKKPNPLPERSSLQLAAGEGGGAEAAYSAIMKASRAMAPVMQIFGGSELVGVFKRI